MTDTSSQLTEEQRKFRFKAAAFLFGVAGISAVAGFGRTLAAVKKTDPNSFNKGMVGSIELAETGSNLAMRALGWGTLFAFIGTGSLALAIWKLSGAKDLNDFRMKLFLTRSEYDRGVNTYSPEGRLLQVEYAIEAIKLGSTAIGISTNEGIVLVVEKRITSPLMEPSKVEKIFEVDRHIGCATSGLMADSRTLLERARVEAQNHWFVYNEPMYVESCARSVSNLAIQFGDSDDSGSAMSRPFGVAILFAGIDNGVPHLYHMDPSGTLLRYNAKAIGSGSEGAQQNLEELFSPTLTLKEAVVKALETLKQVMEEKLSSTNVEVMTMTPKDLFYMYTKEEVEAVIADL
ncbi:CLUMA_CG013211, isoform A [Clunio marinus]|uniref:Proteasome subunit alpha type-5 n=1 Tax=Clunio marinus TaxID=568069 RepID=A0A1J1IK37_9DIPT|nr:CLUMA_CG013211, isoform A [Clunio marinus]